MKKFLLPLAVIAFSASAQNTTHVMNVETKDGNKVQYEVSKITAITFEEVAEQQGLVKYGDFGRGASTAWKLTNVNNKSFELMKIDEENGWLEIAVDSYSGGDSRWMCYQKLDNPEFEVGQTYKMSANVSITPQDFVADFDPTTGLGINTKREMDFGFALFPNNANMATQSDYKPGSSDDVSQPYWYLDTTQDGGKSGYALIKGTEGFKPFSSINNSQRPAAMTNGVFTMDEAHMGGYIVFYVRLRATCTSVKPIKITDVKIEKYTEAD